LSDSAYSDFGFCTVSTQLNLRSMILLDNQSTVNIFCNKKLLKDILVSDEVVTVHGNGGALTTNKKGTLKNYGEVWYHEDAITNILSLKNVRTKFHLTYVSYPESVFTVHKPDGSVNEFRMHQDGLHYFDTKSRSSVSISPVSAEVDASSILVKSAMELQVDLGEPSLHHLKATVPVKPILNLPISTADINRVERDSGPSLPILRGKSVRQASDHPLSECILASDSILAEIPKITLPCDLVPTIKASFLVIVCGHSNFITPKPIKSRAKTLIPDVYHNLMWLNIYPLKGGVFHSIFPRSFNSGVSLDLKLHCQLVFGSHGPAQPSSFSPFEIGKTYKADALLLIMSESNHASFSHLTMTQSSLKSGLPQPDNGDSAAILQELNKLDLCNTFGPPHHLNLLSAKHRSAPESHPFHCVANVNAHLIAGDNIAAPSPTSILESILLTAPIDAAEGQNIAIVDVPNAFMQANLPRSFSKQIRHLNCHYLFISGCAIQGSKSIEYSPTIQMIAVPFTKPLQGKFFVKFRMAIMNSPD